MASATWSTQNNPRILDLLLPPVLWHAARSLSMAARDVLEVKIPAEGSPVVSAQSQSISTFLTHCTLPRSGVTPRVTPFLVGMHTKETAMAKAGEGACLVSRLTMSSF